MSDDPEKSTLDAGKLWDELARLIAEGGEISAEYLAELLEIYSGETRDDDRTDDDTEPGD